MVDMEKIRDLGCDAGIDAEALFDELVLTAENDGSCYPDHPHIAVMRAHRGMEARIHEMLLEMGPLVIKEVAEKWEGDKEPEQTICHRTVCGAPADDDCVHRQSGMKYCVACARRINEHNPGLVGPDRSNDE